MECTSHSYTFHCLQEFLIKIHRELIRMTKTECILSDVKLHIENDYIEKLLTYLVTELKRYGMYSKFEKMSYEYRRKELLILLTKQLGFKIHQHAAGDMGPTYSFDFNSTLRNCSNNADIECKYNEDRMTSCIQRSDLIALYKTKKPHNVYIQYQLYSKILEKIQQELSGIVSMKKDPVVNVLLTELYVRLQQQEEFSQLAHIPIEQERRRLLRLLAAKLMEKCNQITLMDMIRDDTTKEVNNTLYRRFGNCNFFPNKIWEKIVNIGPRQDLMILLYKNYPTFIIEKFLEYLSEAKENIILEQEKLFDAKITLLKKEALDTVANLKQNLEKKKYAESFLNQYAQQLQIHYDITENEFYRQQILKSKIKDIITKIKKNKILANLNMKEICRDIHKRRKIVENLNDTLKKGVSRSSGENIS